MATLNYSQTLNDGDTGDVVASKMSTLLSEIRTSVNNVESAQIASTTITSGDLGSDSVTTAKILDANVTDAKLASPNNSVYRTILSSQCALGADAAAATYALGMSNIQTSGGVTTVTPAVSGTAVPVSGSAGEQARAIIPLIYFDDADYTVANRTQKLRLRAQVNTNATAWSSVTATFGLYPVTFAGAADNLTTTLGTVVSGSTVAIANPTASGTSQGNSGDFTIPSDGQFCIGFVLSAQLTNNAAALLTAQLQTRHTA